MGEPSLQANQSKFENEVNPQIEEGGQLLCKEHPEYTELIQVSYRLLKHSSMSPENIQRKIRYHIHKWG